MALNDFFDPIIIKIVHIKKIEIFLMFLFGWLCVQIKINSLIVHPQNRIMQFFSLLNIPW
jgi:hypothetical protein